MKPRNWKRQRLSEERRARLLSDIERRKWSLDGAVSHPLLIGMFGSGSAALGLTLFISLVCESLYGYWSTREEVTVPARLQSVEWMGGTKTSHLSVRYEYQVGSEKITGTKLALFGEDRGAYHSLASTFDAGTPIRIFIDPRHPRFSVIDRQFKWWPFIEAIIVSGVFTVGGFFILRHLLRTRRRLGLSLSWRIRR
ncbi:MAG: DUF3592 domain-containing protein [Luteolibacter sp.]